MALTFKQGNFLNATSTGNPAALTLSASVTLGSFLVVAFNTNSSNPITGISDNAGNTYQNLFLSDARGNSLWVIPSNLGSAALNIQVSINQAGASYTIWAAEWTGQSLSSPVDAFSANAVFAGPTALQSPTIVTSWTNETLIGTAWSYPAGLTAGTGWVGETSGANIAFFEDKSVALPGSYFATAAASGTPTVSYISIIGVKTVTSVLVSSNAWVASGRDFVNKKNSPLWHGR